MSLLLQLAAEVEGGDTEEAAVDHLHLSHPTNYVRQTYHLVKGITYSGTCILQSLPLEKSQSRSFLIMQYVSISSINKKILYRSTENTNKEKGIKTK